MKGPLRVVWPVCILSLSLRVVSGSSPADELADFQAELRSLDSLVNASDVSDLLAAESDDESNPSFDEAQDNVRMSETPETSSYGLSVQTVAAYLYDESYESPYLSDESSDESYDHESPDMNSPTSVDSRLNDEPTIAPSPERVVTGSNDESFDRPISVLTSPSPVDTIDPHPLQPLGSPDLPQRPSVYRQNEKVVDGVTFLTLTLGEAEKFPEKLRKVEIVEDSDSSDEERLPVIREERRKLSVRRGVPYLRITTPQPVPQTEKSSLDISGILRRFEESLSGRMTYIEHQLDNMLHRVRSLERLGRPGVADGSDDESDEFESDDDDDEEGEFGDRDGGKGEATTELQHVNSADQAEEVNLDEND